MVGLQIILNELAVVAILLVESCTSSFVCYLFNFLPSYLNIFSICIAKSLKSKRPATIYEFAFMNR